MKILQATEELITNQEVLDWSLNYIENSKEHKFPNNLKQLTVPLTKYLQETPAGTQSYSSLHSLFAQLEKFQLTVGELQMIANQRPNSILQLMCILFDCERRFTEEEMAGILQIIDTTLEPSPIKGEMDMQSTPSSL
ncbi:hypothetical protein GpartN1_g3001.t1 [Galdieria partita]|uniref:DNA-directed RNA polymerase III subunit RPC9 n=1 Tax=Galdieria partita TaxID=83374 RepID=A0A9C7PVE2_9RHOD|nr:hypothetical protein GpartN1_g2652.t1 [Galdieria partita]GJQ11210.1 hypothetical protein GpartN1_g3001.t1 [Galdieria partita]